MTLYTEKSFTPYHIISIFRRDEKIGSAYFYIIENRQGQYGLIEDIEVIEKYRGQGIGKELVKNIIEIAKSEGCYKIIATSRTSRKNVHKFYTSLGFKKWGYEFRMDL